MQTARDVQVKSWVFVRFVSLDIIWMDIESALSAKKLVLAVKLKMPVLAVMLGISWQEPMIVWQANA